MQRLWNLPQRWGGWEPFRPKAGGQNGLRGPPPHCKPTVKFWEFPNQSAVLRQIFPDVSVRCRPWPVGGAAPGAERGKRGRAGGLSSHTREAATAEPESAAAAHLAPPAGRSGGAEEVVRSPGRDADAGGKSGAPGGCVYVCVGGGAAAGPAGSLQEPRAGVGPLGTMPRARRARVVPHPRCGAAFPRSCPRRVGGSGSGPGAARAGPWALGPGPAGRGRWMSSPLGPAREPLPAPHLPFHSSAVGVVPLCCRGGARS